MMDKETQKELRKMVEEDLDLSLSVQTEPIRHLYFGTFSDTPSRPSFLMGGSFCGDGNDRNQLLLGITSPRHLRRGGLE